MIAECYCCGELADCTVDGENYCESCATELLEDWFRELLLKDKAKALNVDFERLY